MVADKWMKFPQLITSQVLDLLCPASCQNCHKSIDTYTDYLCNTCWEKCRLNLQSDYCPTCGHNVGAFALIDDRCHQCQNRRPVVSRVVRVGEFDGLLRDLIHQLKYYNQSHLDSFLGKLLASAIIGDKALSRVDVFVPIPLYWKRKWLRKYNQSELLARQTSYHLKMHGIKTGVCTDLIKVKDTPAQTDLSISERVRNLSGSFVVRPDLDFENKHICLVDDVTTTGTTLRVAANALKSASPKMISAAVITAAGNV